MKELYLDAELEIVKFSMVDIITTSGGEETSDPTVVPTNDPDMGDIDIWD